MSATRRKSGSRRRPVVMLHSAVKPEASHVEEILQVSRQTVGLGFVLALTSMVTSELEFINHTDLNFAGTSNLCRKDVGTSHESGDHITPMGINHRYFRKPYAGADHGVATVRPFYGQRVN